MYVIKHLEQLSDTCIGIEGLTLYANEDIDILKIKLEKLYKKDKNSLTNSNIKLSDKYILEYDEFFEMGYQINDGENYYSASIEKLTII